MSDSTYHRLDVGFAALDPRDVAWLIGQLTPSARRAWRKDIRDRAICDLATLSEFVSQRDVAPRLASALRRYAASSWRFDRGRPAPADPMRAAMHAVLTATGGEPPGSEACRRALAGLTSEKTAEFPHHGMQDKAPEICGEGTDAQVAGDKRSCGANGRGLVWGFCCQARDCLRVIVPSVGRRFVPTL
jgi:hypothetical protein